MNNFNFWVNYLKIVSLVFVGMGIMWAFLGSFDPFGIYDSQMAKAFFGQDQLPADVAQATQFLLGPFGMTSAGYFILQYFIVVNAFAKREKWAYQAIVIAFFVWFCFDTIISWSHGAYFNILMANVPTLVAMLPPLLATKKAFYP